jgi:hypothetical protein
MTRELESHTGLPTTLEEKLEVARLACEKKYNSINRFENCGARASSFTQNG